MSSHPLQNVLSRLDETSNRLRVLSSDLKMSNHQGDFTYQVGFDKSTNLPEFPGVHMQLVDMGTLLGTDAHHIPGKVYLAKCEAGAVQQQVIIEEAVTVLVMSGKLYISTATNPVGRSYGPGQTLNLLPGEMHDYTVLENCVNLVYFK